MKEKLQQRLLNIEKFICIRGDIDYAQTGAILKSCSQNFHYWSWKRHWNQLLIAKKRSLEIKETINYINHAILILSIPDQSKLHWWEWLKFPNRNCWMNFFQCSLQKLEYSLPLRHCHISNFLVKRKRWIEDISNENHIGNKDKDFTSKCTLIYQRDRPVQNIMKQWIT